jgi:ADP-ribose pyrophosphatase YjhB (NUDIX family)
MDRRQLSSRSRPVCPRCGFVWYQNPLPVAVAIAEQGGAIVLIRRRWAPGRGRWALPGGFVEHAEAPDAAAVRETREETGLMVSVQGVVGAYGYVEANGQRSGIVIAFRTLVVSGELQAGDDAEAACLITLDADPIDLAFDTHRAALRDWAKARGLAPPDWLAAGDRPHR